MEVVKHRIPAGSLVEIIETGARLFVVQRYYEYTNPGKPGNVLRPVYSLLWGKAVMPDLPPRTHPVAGLGDKRVYSFSEEELMVIERADAEEDARPEGYTGGVVSHDVKTHWLYKWWGSESLPQYANSAVALIIKEDDDVVDIVLANMHMFLPFSWVHSLAQPHWKGKRLFTLFYDNHGVLERIEEVVSVRDLWKDPAGTVTFEEVSGA